MMMMMMMMMIVLILMIAAGCDCCETGKDQSIKQPKYHHKNSSAALNLGRFSSACCMARITFFSVRKEWTAKDVLG